MLNLSCIGKISFSPTWQLEFLQFNDNLIKLELNSIPFLDLIFTQISSIFLNLKYKVPKPLYLVVYLRRSFPIKRLPKLELERTITTDSATDKL